VVGEGYPDGRELRGVEDGCNKVSVRVGGGQIRGHVGGEEAAGVAVLAHAQNAQINVSVVWEEGMKGFLIV